MKKIFLTLFIFLALNDLFGQCESLSLTLNGANPTCPGFCDGTFTAVVTGYNIGFNAEVMDEDGNLGWIPGSMGTTPNILCPGMYYVTIVDSLGCAVTDSIFIADIDEMEVVLTVTLPTDLDSCNGVVVVDTVLNAQGDYDNLSFFWNPGAPDGLGQMQINDVCYGDYNLVINNELGCSMVHSFTVGNLGFDNRESISVAVYPNPFDELIFIESHEPLIGYELYELSGRLLKSERMNFTSINLSFLESGIYVLHLTTSSGEVWQRVVKN